MEKTLDIKKSEKTKLLIVDDEADIREVLRFNLENEGYEIDEASSVAEAEEILSDHALILLDIMMAGESGYHFADRLRKKGETIPIIFLTAKNTENDMLTGFSIGADDYIHKPFSIKEVVARIKSVLRRVNPIKEAESSLIVYDGLSIDPNAKTIWVDGENVLLTKTEFKILLILVSHPGHLFSRAKILQLAWEDNGYVLERTVDVHITRLRRKIGAYGACIINRSGYGYGFRPEMKKIE